MSKDIKKILITNDDGIEAEGIVRLAKEAVPREARHHTVSRSMTI